MEINALIVDDDTFKLGRIHEVLVDAGLDPDRIKHALNSVEAVRVLSSTRFDIMFLDLNLPRRFGEGPRRGGGLDILTELERDIELHRPRYIVGITAYEDVLQEFGEEFESRLWTLVHYQENSDYWVSRIKAKIEYVRAVRASDNFTDGETHGVDLAIICALGGVELNAIKKLDCDWQPLRLPHDETRYLSGVIGTKAKQLSVIAAAAPRMGMPASATLTSKIVNAFRPRCVAMVGICAGRARKVALGDIIVADPVWDWGSGKIISQDNQPRFQPAPHHIELNVDLRAKLIELCRDVALLATIKKNASGPKPSDELRAHIGPLASGAAVVASGETFQSLLDQHWGLLGIEMEAYGVATACNGCGKPRPLSLLIKSVCDFADQDKNDDFQEYAADTSAQFLYEAVRRIL